MNDNNLHSNNKRDARVLDLYEKVLEIEQRLIPTGLHIFGLKNTSTEITELLTMVVAFQRPELDLPALTDLIAEGLDLPSYSELLKKSNNSEQHLIGREKVESLARKAVGRIVEGNVHSQVALWINQQAGVSIDLALKIFSFLDKIQQQLKSNEEIDSFLRALRGEYVPPGPGGDVLQNPSILPTGRNTHAINPYAIPSSLAVRNAEPLVSALLDRYHSDLKKIPESIAMVLWGIDNIKQEGQAVAQVLWLLGVKPIRDGLNRVADISVIPLEDLGRPRIDVVMTVSGIFRDLFGSTMDLLDRSVKRVAALDEPHHMNFVCKHVEEKIKKTGCSFEEAATRVFSNAAGNYGTNVNFMVLQSQWEDARELGDLFVRRKSFAYGRDSNGITMEGRQAEDLLDDALSRVEVTYQSIDSTEVGISDVDHYFEYLGGVTKAVEKRAGKQPKIYLSDSLTPNSKIRTLQETLQLESRTKVLNPKWYEGQLRHGFSGVAEIEHQLTNTFGWSATANAVDDWIYDEVVETFVLDGEMLNRLKSLNPSSVHTLVGRLLEASGRGFWSTKPEILNKLKEVFSSLEDALEGVSS
ncbi:MAG: cobaltochelatase subunit CobN [Acidobacteriia bacterium]|nr:cobaltochelatase subunit CobN [Terriglobia bacterium]